MLAAFLLVLLRMSIGWHFLYEGMWKHQHPEFTSEAFLMQARGPLAERFYELIPDYDGRQRLSEPKVEDELRAIHDQYVSHYNFGEEQRADAQEILQRRVTDFKLHYELYKPEIDEYLAELDRYRTAGPTEPKYAQERAHDKRMELRAAAGPLLAELERIKEDLRRELRSLLDEDQIRRGRPEVPPSQLEQIDQAITYGLIAVGVCLLVGLFTRTANLLGALFLLSVVLAQPAWPGLYPALPPSMGHSLGVTKDAIEMLAMLALAATPVGRWAGLDFFIHHLIVRPIFSSKGKRHAS